jgi:hypothetical protein
MNDMETTEQPTPVTPTGGSSSGLRSTDLVGVWSPIETAPENQTVLLYCPDRGVFNKERIELGKAAQGSYFADGRRIGGTWSYHSWATHWMPLPEPPKPKTPTPKVSHRARNL